MKKLKVIVIGLGHDHAPPIFDSAISQNELFEVVAFAVPKEEELTFSERIEKYKKLGIPQLSVSEALDIPGLDAAIIETEEHNLCKYAKMAVERGLHIHMDKPGSPNASEFYGLADEIKARGLIFSIGYMYRFNPVIRSAIERAKSGELGKIYSVEIQMSCEHKPEKRKWLARLPGGMMFYLGCHLVDMVYQIQGEPLEIIPCNASINADGAEDFGMAVFKYENGCSFIKTAAAEPGGFFRRQLVICGERGTIEIKPLEFEDEKRESGRLDLYTEKREFSSAFNWNDTGTLTVSDMYNRYDSMMQHFAACVRGEKEPLFSVDYEKNLYRLLLKACNAKEEI